MQHYEPVSFCALLPVRHTHFKTDVLRLVSNEVWILLHERLTLVAIFDTYDTPNFKTVVLCLVSYEGRVKRFLLLHKQL